jgi:[acyl-carrier-protein] S-malonyltransferase
MARDLYDAFPEAKRALDECDEALAAQGSRLSSTMFDGPAETLTLTNNAQPALLAHGAAAWAVAAAKLKPYVRAAAGHSLGELTAYHAAGTLSLTDAVRLVRTRGDLMLRAGTENPGTMAAILGTLSRPIDDVCREASASGEVVAANYNADEQIVISGAVAAVDRAMELAKAAGAKRAMRLNVSGAFHSPLMRSAADGFRTVLAGVHFNAPAFPICSNVDATPNTSADAARDLLLRQLTSPVRWTDVVRRLAADHPSAQFIEMGPGNVLTGLMKRIAPNVQASTCGTAAELEQLLARIS